MDKRYQVFVSSTYSDLAKQRESVIYSLIKNGFIAVGMEQFPSTDESQMEYINKVIEESDYYILIMKGKYGTTGEDGISYTEKEYRYAVKLGIPCIVFIYEDFDNIPLGETDRDPEKYRRLIEFKAELEQNKIVSYWQDERDLREKVKDSLYDICRRKPGIGYVRGNQLIDISIVNERERLAKVNEHLIEEIKALRNASREDETQLLEFADSELGKEFVIRAMFKGRTKVSGRNFVDKIPIFLKVSLSEVFLECFDQIDFLSYERSIVAEVVTRIVPRHKGISRFTYVDESELNVRLAARMRDALESIGLIKASPVDLENYDRVLGENGREIYISRTYKWYRTDKAKGVYRIMTTVK